MPHYITLERLPAGYVVNSAKKGEVVNVQIREFVSSEDGILFIERLEGLPSDLIAKLPLESRVIPSTIDHFLAVIHRDRSADIYVNELKLILEIRPKRAIKAGEKVFEDDIVDVQKLNFGNVQIPDDTGVIFIFSEGWRKGLYYDLAPLHDSNTMRDYNIKELLGHYYAYVNHQDIFRLTEDEWQILFDQQWFLFITLTKSIRKQIVNRIQNQDQIDDLLNSIAAHVSKSKEEMLSRWENNLHIKPHFDLIKHAFDRYVEQDYMSATAILYPQIEGIMRTHHITSGNPEKLKHDNVVSSALDARKSEQHEFSPLLPHKFETYLKKVYLAHYDPKKPSVPVSRHSVSHGDAAPEDYSLKAATIGLLILDQLFFFLP